MMINRSVINFHETFQPEGTYLAKIIELADTRFTGSKHDISSITGIPTGKQKGKVEPHIKYASYMGLITFKVDRGIYNLSLTDLGKEVYKQDKYLHENLTHWLCHYNISRPEIGAPQWNYIVHHGFSGFYQSNSSEYHLNRANKMYGTSVDFEEMFGVVKRSYSDGFFSDLNYLKWADNVEYVEHVERPELLYLYGYSILDMWSRLFKNKREITYLDLTQQIGIGNIFGLGDGEIESVLINLADEGFFSINRQLYPMTIITLSTTEEIIPILFDLLL